MVQNLSADSVKGAIRDIVPYLESLNDTVYKAIYFDGWANGLGASAVLRAIAEQHSFLMKKFDKVIHIDCSRWKNRRALQRAIADELKLPQQVMSLFDRQDEEDDFSMVDEGSRAEIGEVARVILGSLLQYRCLVLFHNGSNDVVDLYGCGLPPPGISGTTVLWTFGGRLRRGYEVKVDKSHVFISSKVSNWNFLVWEEAKVISLYTRKLGLGITLGIVRECLLYLLTLDNRGGKIMDYNWLIHASNYWVCDGIIVGGQESNKAWEVAHALHQEIRLEDYPVHKQSNWRDDRFDAPSNRWICIINPHIHLKTRPTQGTTTLFLACQSGSAQPLASLLPNDMFHQADQLHVLKLCRCSFSFLSPPFHSCHNLRFLGLDRCTDSPQGGEGEEKDRQALEIFQRLWVLDLWNTDWELDFPQETEEQMAANIREIYIKKGRIWHNHLAWRRLQNLHKLRVIEPTCSWVTGKMDEFTDMVKLEQLDLSGNSTIQVLPSLSKATGLKTLVLDGCIGLEHICPEGLPPSLETFCLDAGLDPKFSARLSKISLAGCVHLKNFLLRGALPELEELNLSGTSIRKVDLSDQVVQVRGLEKLFLIGCKQLRGILWWEGSRELNVLCISTHGRNSDDLRPSYSDSSPIIIQRKKYNGYVIASDVRIIQSLLIRSFFLITRSLYLHLYVPPSSSSSKGQSISSEAAMSKACHYGDVLLQLHGVVTIAYGEITSWPAPLSFHVEVGEGISFTDMESDKAIEAVNLIMERQNGSLHVHDNSRILTTIWASDLLTAGSIWRKGTVADYSINFKALQSIHLHNCPRLKYVLPFRGYTLPSLETLNITHCGDLRQVFPWDDPRRREVKKFQNLKHIHLHDLPSLQEICEGGMFAPMLESIKLRGCWGLRRLPAVGRSHRRPVVHCEKGCWEELEWDGLQAGHDPSLYELHPSSSYYKKKRLLRGTVLR
ncbi:unnamed protein product [Urochloa decumbens]|uniref:Disease resistance protein At4g27190-like leucine-rich repeats domain-containing protein n=1 Tax=Urochloa decumbens TaxID=240449 RepID=A0ABC9CXN1_9POAL